MIFPGLQILSILLDPADEMLERKIEQLEVELSVPGISQILRFQPQA
jgi:hypothetical protein